MTITRATTATDGLPETGRYQPARQIDDTLRDPSRSERLTAGESKMTRSWIHFTRGRFVRQARVGLGDLREEHLSRGLCWAGRDALSRRWAERSGEVRRRLSAASDRQRRCCRARCERPARRLADVAIERRCRCGDQPSARGDALRLSRHGGRSSLLRASRLRCVRDRVWAYLLRTGRLGTVAEGDDVPAIARGGRQPVAGRRVAAADPPLRTRAGRPSYADRSDHAGGTGCRRLRLAEAR